MKRPIIGLFLDSAVIKNLKINKSPKKFYRLKLYAEAASTAEITLIAFSLNDLSFNPDSLDGIRYYPHQQCWETVKIPHLPDLIYDRFVGSGQLQVQQADHMRHQLSRRGVKKINARHYFDKYEVYEILSQCERLSPHLPLTEKYHNLHDLKKLFRLKDKLFVKATNGRRGKQVIYVTQMSHGGYQYSFFKNQLFSGKVESLQALEKVIQSVTGTGAAIIQQAVELIEVDNRRLDLRAEMQRNGQGKLEIVAVLARLGNKKSPITTHGNSYRFEDFFYTRLNQSKEAVAALKKVIESFLLTIYDCMEKAYGPFAEIAIDFGIDRRGKIWFFECNAKSMKVSLINSADHKTVQRAFLNPMLYAKYMYHNAGIL